jgi:hypothetical protein
MGGKIPAETASFRSTTVSPVREDWMVETIWTKLAAPHTVIETSLRNSSQERNFLLQRPGGEPRETNVDRPGFPVEAHIG